MPQVQKLAILDDYQGVTLSHPAWAKLPHLQPAVFQDTITDLDALATRLAPFDAILAMRERTPFNAALINRLPNLRLLMTTGERNRGIDAAACAARGVTFCGTSSFGAPTVEITWGLILSLMRGLPEQMSSLRAGTWQGLTAFGDVGRTVEGKTLGVVGLGKLGARVARVGQAFGMKVIAWSQNLTVEAAAAVGATRVEKAALMQQADVITLHLILSDRSRGIIGAEELARMKPDAVIVNTSRGPLIDQDALLAALHGMRIGGAGLDVFDQEPLPATHPILAAPRTVLTPHLGYVSAENYAAYFTGAVEAIAAFEAGSPIRVIT
ncbi:MAG: D-2-hydroxyacid dehydrogenase family protein [Alphaproteobacteria bacterium]|nr:D-2-hydroxyacid dehydrogenase family protein [Alphaproteobacteria bacterium]